MRTLDAEARIRAPRSDRQRATIAFGIALMGFVALQLTAETYTPIAPVWRIATATVTFCSLGIPVFALVLGGFGRLSLALPVGYFLSSVLFGSVVVSFVLTYEALYGQSLVTPTLGGLIAGGLLLAFPVRTAALVGVVVGVFASGLFVYLVSIATYGAAYVYRQGFIQYVGLALIPVALGLTPALADLLRRVVNQPLALLLVVNALNVMDAILTWVGRSNGTLEEANPIVAWSGLLPKVLLVGTLSALVYRMKPRWLVIPVGVFLGLNLYHLSGLVL